MLHGTNWFINLWIKIFTLADNENQAAIIKLKFDTWQLETLQNELKESREKERKQEESIAQLKRKIAENQRAPPEFKRIVKEESSWCNML